MSIRHRIAAGSLILASATLLAFLGTWEGEGQNTVYPDKLAHGLPTVCKGITKYTSPYPVVVGDYWSEDRCEEVERMVVSNSQFSLADCLTNQSITQHTFDALSSHAHNFGVARTCASRAVGLINAGKIAEGCRALAYGPKGEPVWSFANGRFYRGLHRRRIAEMELCLRSS